MFSEGKDILVLLGPTASGKSKLALKLAEKYKARIISADAYQIYKGLDIGTAKVSLKDRDKIPHYLIDIKEPTENYSIAAFQKQCLEKISLCRKDQRPIIICGGSTLYIHAFLYNYALNEVERNNENHQRILEKFPNKESQWLKLKELNPLNAEKIHQNNAKRLLRALEKEIYKKKEQTTVDHNVLRKDCILWGIDIKRELLYEKINERVDKMFAQGLIEEVIQLRRQGVTKNMQSMQAIGYKEVFAFFENKINKVELKDLIKKNTRHFAKRQFTWFKKFEGIEWVNQDWVNNFK